MLLCSQPAARGAVKRYKHRTLRWGSSETFTTSSSRRCTRDPQGRAGRGGQRLSHTEPGSTRAPSVLSGARARAYRASLPPQLSLLLPGGEAAGEGREEGGAAPLPPPGSCREGDARCHFPSSPRAAPCPPPAPAAGSAPSPGAAPRAPRRQQAGPRRRQPASALPPAPRHGRALRGAAPPRLGSARFCPAAGLGSARLHANGPERHGQIASQPGAGGADGAPGQPPARGGSAGRAGAAGPGGTAGAREPGGAAGSGRGAALGAGSALGKVWHPERRRPPGCASREKPAALRWVGGRHALRPRSARCQ